MSVSRIRVSRAALSENNSQATSAFLGFALGYDAVSDQGEMIPAQKTFIATVTRNINDPALRADWAALEADGVASPFQAYGWQRGLVSHRMASPDGETLFVTVRDAQRDVVAILPLRSRDRHGVTIIDYLGAEFCDTCQPLLSRTSTLTSETLPDFIAAIARALPAADILRLQKMQRDLFGQPNPFATLTGVSASPDETFPVELTLGNPGFVAATSAYKAYQKQWRKMSRRDGIAFEIFDTPETIAAAFDAMLVMRNARFADLNRDDLLDRPEVAAFYRAMALLPAEERVARICGLRVGETTVAYIYMLDHAGKFSTVISAIDNSVGNTYAPGLILFTKIFERAVAESYAHGDIGIGYMFYKTRFASRPNPLFVWEKPLSLKGRIVLAGLSTARSTKRWAKDNRLIRRIAETVLHRKVTTHPAPKVEASDED